VRTHVRARPTDRGWLLSKPPRATRHRRLRRCCSSALSLPSVSLAPLLLLLPTIQSFLSSSTSKPTCRTQSPPAHVSSMITTIAEESRSRGTIRATMRPDRSSREKERGAVFFALHCAAACACAASLSLALVCLCASASLLAVASNQTRWQPPRHRHSKRTCHTH